MDNIIYEPFSFEKQTFQCISYNESEFVMNWKMLPKGKVDPHIHEFSDEHFQIIKGTVQFKVDGQTLIKSAGEELMVRKGVVHSIVNNTDEEIDILVTYSPCADIHRMFQIMATLDKSKPGSSLNIAKYFYLAPRLGLKSFSTPQPKIAFVIVSMIITIVGKLSGWDKMIATFR